MRVLSLFSGIGGLDLGIKLAAPEARVVAYVERDDYCRRILAARMRDGWLDEAPIYEDIATFDGREWAGAAELVCGGFPCQDISDAGRRAGIGGARSGLWSEMARVVSEVRPRYVFVENVAAILGRGMDTVLGDLARLGFDAEWSLFSAADVGAPHLRKRLFLLAYGQGQREERPAGQRSEARASAGRGSTQLAHAHGSRGGDAQSERERRPAAEPGGNGAELAHTAGGRHEPLAGSVLGDAEGNGAPERLQPQSGDGALAHAQRPERRSDPLAGSGSGEGHDGEGQAAGGTGECRGAVPLFPPGPADLHGWRCVLAADPALEPAVCRLAHGTAKRVDQLRALGNAVLPLVAAYAFRALAARVSDQEIEPSRATEAEILAVMLEGGGIR